MKTPTHPPGHNVVRMHISEASGAVEACRLLVRHHDEQIALCRRLEDLADQLPDVVDTQSCLRLAKQINAMIRTAHEHEERTLFPMLLAAHDDDERLGATIERLRYEHWEDESYADEVSDGLERFVTDRASSNPETLAYMLRGFFEGLRRHIAFEREYILPLLTSESPQ
ncbi:hemerythrin domain-containing protein [Oricola cellulosilytica]|uniref:Hemerythrin domain-containing protein n=1 Tax=Oricola cellulosilytica TaxID=1429082 RepID=A0A4R0PBV6_9HYPH|nr:hemerythrin domain-containing protein [Oricola cellulosilytica]TCD14942.1 hemerythrin domain-containing protein [Oricola cellulosilytica]